MKNTMLNKAGKLLIIIGATVVVCALVFLLLVPQTRTILFEGVPLTNIAGKDKQSVQNETIIIPGFEKLTIPPDQTQVSTFLYNPANNTCYFQIRMILLDSKETLYESKMLAPGHAINEIELEHSFPEGEYDAIIQYRAFSSSDFSDLNGADVPFKLMVKNE